MDLVGGCLQVKMMKQTEAEDFLSWQLRNM